MISPSFSFPEGVRVAYTGTFTILPNPVAWIRARGGHPVLWSPRVRFLLVGSRHRADAWKLQQASVATNITILYETDIPPAPKDLWVDRYRPRRVEEIIGHAAQIKELTDWLKGFGPATSNRIALLTGPPGIGKTTTAHMVASALGFEIVEYNASDERSAKAVKGIVDKCGKFSHIQLSADGRAAPKRLLIMDEVDGMSSGDRGGVAELALVARNKAAAFPILCIANERTSPKIRPLASVALDIRFARPTKTVIAKSLVALLKDKEGLALRVGDVEDMCERAGNDIRALLNSLQFSSDVSATTIAGGKDEVLRMDPFSATGRVFGSVADLRAREEAVFVDTGLVPLMVGEAYIAAGAKSRSAKTDAAKLEAIAKAADSLTMWDMIDTRIHRSQAWGLLPAAVSSVVTAARCVDGPAPFQIFPAWLGKQSKRGKHRRLLEDLRGRTGGEGNLLDTRSALRTLLFDPKTKGPKDIVARLDAFNMTRDDMLETLVDTCFTGDEAAVALDTKTKGAITREWKKVHPTSAAVIATKETELEMGEEDVGDDDD